MVSKPDDLSSHQFVLDLKNAQQLRAQSAKDPQAGLKAAAKQFESMFLQMVMKSMRDATPQDGPLDSDSTRFYTGILDEQMAQQLGSTGQLGFARQIEQQLGRYLPSQGSSSAQGASALSGIKTYSGQAAQPSATIRGAARNYGGSSGPSASAGSDSVAGGDASGGASPAARDFVNRLWPDAVTASQTTGVPAQFLIAHAALETGWGKSEIRRADGSSSHNLFGMKAGRSWQGDSVDATTTEYSGGTAQTLPQRFRAYGSYAEAFQDYANTLTSNPRFAGVVGQQNGTAFARSLQAAGYATDPAYADKLSRIINGSTLRQALAS